MIRTESQALESKAVNRIVSRLGWKKKKEGQNEGISLNVAENTRDTNLTYLKFAPNLECYRKIKHLSARTLNVIETKES
jgi:hypothetical protein